MNGRILPFYFQFFFFLIFFLYHTLQSLLLFYAEFLLVIPSYFFLFYLFLFLIFSCDFVIIWLFSLCLLDYPIVSIFCNYFKYDKIAMLNKCIHSFIHFDQKRKSNRLRGRSSETAKAHRG
eukprot:TRINITY_DN6581_c0_g2_i1.p1 TRINITY_DN6581_c0_g2~~TRINITY_DN6581_c0_g2_i1.p1  ORF type:complete len:121 (-),score=11.97 TRINITY_DN6581_c0_g2_i1:2-364(-)